jgi:hypothetical protein
MAHEGQPREVGIYYDPKEIIHSETVEDALRKVTDWSIADGGSVVENIPPELMHNRDFLLEAARRSYGRIMEDKNFPEAYLEDRNFIMEVLKKTEGMAFRHIPEHYYTDREFVAEVLRHHPEAYFHSPSEIRDDLEFATMIVRIDAKNYERLSRELRDNWTIKGIYEDYRRQEQIYRAGPRPRRG